MTLDDLMSTLPQWESSVWKDGDKIYFQNWLSRRSDTKRDENTEFSLQNEPEKLPSNLLRPLTPTMCEPVGLREIAATNQWSSQPSTRKTYDQHHTIWRLLYLLALPIFLKIREHSQLRWKFTKYFLSLVVLELVSISNIRSTTW